MPCRIAGCENTWTWYAAQQIRGFGQKPPERMCDQHLAQFSELADREVPCRTPGCANTWLWKRGAQLADLQRHGKLKRPSRLCADCLAAERDTTDAAMPCKVEGCRRTWVWSRDAQLRHRLWVLRQRAKARAAEAKAEARAEAEAKLEAAPPVSEALSPAPDAEAAPENLSAETASQAEPTAEAGAVAPAAVAAEPAGEAGKKKRRRKRKQRVRAVPDPEGPPQRMCGLCAQKLGKIVAREVPCKVHGCVRTWTLDRASQLRAWVHSGSDDVDFDPPAAKRMCEVCREFCRKHPDREVACGRPGCVNTWTYKTGAQLQAFLAGRLQDPLKLCAECARGEFAKQAEEAGLPEGAEIMPCVVPACPGQWVYVPGQKLMAVADGELAPDRMCTKCRRERGLPPLPHLPPGETAELEVSAEDTAEPEHEDDEDELLAGEHDHPADEPAGEPEAGDADDLGAPEAEAEAETDADADAEPATPEGEPGRAD